MKRGDLEKALLPEFSNLIYVLKRMYSGSATPRELEYQLASYIDSRIDLKLNKNKRVDFSKDFNPIKPKDTPTELSGFANVFEADLDYLMGTSGIYFLYKEEKLVYIGKSVNVLLRVGSHVSQKIKMFDKALFIKVFEKDLGEFEKKLINHFKPIYNKLCSIETLGYEAVEEVIKKLK